MDLTDTAAMADLLEEPLGARPTVTAMSKGLLVGDPLPLKVALVPSPSGFGIEVRCVLVLGDLPVGMALMAANQINLGDGSGRARVTHDGEDLLLVSELPVYPIQPGREISDAFDVVLGSARGFTQAAKEIRETFEAVQAVTLPAAPAGPERPALPVEGARPTADATVSHDPARASAATPVPVGYL